MIARKVDEAGPFANLAQELLHHVVMGLRPVPARFQLPSIDDVADQIDGVRIVGFEEFQQRIRLAPLGAEVKVRQEQRPYAHSIRFLSHGSSDGLAEQTQTGFASRPHDGFPADL